MSSELVQKRLEDGICKRNYCGKLVADGSAHCPAHWEDEKRYKRTWAAKRRRAFKRREGQRKCKRCGTPRRPYKPCTGCAIERDQVEKLKLPPETADTEKAARIAAATWVDPDGRVRYRGKMRRGQQPHSELNTQDLQWAEECYRAFKAGVRLLDDPSTKDWDREERARVKAATANQGERAARHIGDVVQRLKPAKRPGRDEDE